MGFCRGLCVTGTLWLFNIAMENRLLMEDLMWKIIYKWAIFHGYVE
jgi:hypothetical protein